MNKYKLFQIHLTDAEYNKVNAEGHNSVEKHMTKLDMSFSDDPGALAKKAFETMSFAISRGRCWDIGTLEVRALSGHPHALTARGSSASAGRSQVPPNPRFSFV